MARESTPLMAEYELPSFIIEGVAERLRHARLAAGYKTQAEFAKALGVGKTTYNAHEKSRNGIPVPWALRYSKMLNCDLAWLLTGEGAMRPDVVDDNALRLPETLPEDVQEALRLFLSRLGARSFAITGDDGTSFTDVEVSILREAIDLFERVHGDARPNDAKVAKSALAKVKTSGTS